MSPHELTLLFNTPQEIRRQSLNYTIVALLQFLTRIYVLLHLLCRQVSTVYILSKHQLNENKYIVTFEI